MIIAEQLKHPLPDLKTLGPLDWFDNSILDSFLKCNRYAYYQRILRLDTSTPNMNAGTVLHSGMETFAKTKSSQAADFALAKQYQKFQANLQGKESRFEFSSLLRVFQLYQQRYQNDEIVYVAQEWPFGLELKDDEEKPFWLVGKSDGFGGYLSDEWVVERKSTKSLRKDYIRGLELSRQASTYTFAAKRVVERNGGDPKRIRGVLFDIIAFSDSKVDFLRFPVLRTDNELQEWHADTQELVSRIRGSFDHNRIKARNRLPTKNRNQCAVYGECPFTKLCGAWEQQLDKTKTPALIQNFRTNIWRPFE